MARKRRGIKTNGFHDIVKVSFASQDTTRVADDPVAEGDEAWSTGTGKRDSKSCSDSCLPALCAGDPSRISRTCQI